MASQLLRNSDECACHGPSSLKGVCRLPDKTRAPASEFNCLPVELEGGAAPRLVDEFLFCFGPRSLIRRLDRVPRRVWFFISAAKGPAGA